VPELKHFPFFSKAPSHHGIILIYFDLARHCGQHQNAFAVPRPARVFWLLPNYASSSDLNWEWHCHDADA
jgi:hypothetical protein